MVEVDFNEYLEKALAQQDRNGKSVFQRTGKAWTGIAPDFEEAPQLLKLMVIDVRVLRTRAVGLQGLLNDAQEDA